MRILVTGSKGFIGSRLTKALEKKGHTVLCFDRVDGNLLEESGMDTIRSKRFDAVYHLAAELDETSPTLWKTNVEGTRNLLEICKRRGIERFILLNPIGILGEAKEPLREDDPYNPATLYEKSKVEAERLVMDYRLKHQIPYTIIRSTIVYGPNRFWSQIFAAAKGGYPLIGNGKNTFHLIYVDDAIRFLVLALKPEARNQIYNLAGPDPHTYGETYKMICRAMKVPFPKETLHPAAAKAAAFAHVAKAKLRRERPDVTKVPASIDRLLRNRIVNIEKAKALGFKPKYTLQKGLEKTAKELKK